MKPIQIKKTFVSATKIQSLLSKESIDFNTDEDFNVITSILLKDKFMRSSFEKDLIVKAFSSFKFFKELLMEMGLQQVQGLFKELTYERFNPRQTVFNIGDIGKYFYIIVRGSVWVLLMKQGVNADVSTKEANQKQQAPKSKGPRKTLLRSKSHLKKKSTEPVLDAELDRPVENENDEYADLTDPEFLAEKFNTMIQVSTLTTGMSFGEIALTKHVPRAATIVCKEETHFVMLSREKFNQFLSEYYYQIQQKNVQFLASIQIFSSWSEPLLNNLYYHFQIKEFVMNTCLYKETQPARFSLNLNGEIEISRLIYIQHSRITESESLVKNFSKAGMKNYMKQKRVRVSLLGPGQIFGQEEILEKSQERQSMAICVSEKCKLFILDRERFSAYCLRGLTLNQLESLFKKQNDWRTGNESNIARFESPQFLKDRAFPEFDRELTQESRVSITKRKSTVSMIEKHRSLVTDPLQFEKQVNSMHKKSLIPHLKDYEEPTSVQLMQNKTHISAVVDNFTKRFDTLKKLVHDTKTLDVDNPYFSHEWNKTPRMFSNPTQIKREEAEIKLQRGRQHLIKLLRLPSVLRHVTEDPETPGARVVTEPVLKSTINLLSPSPVDIKTDIF